MKKLIPILLLLISGCASTAPIVNPPCPECPGATVVYKYDTVSELVHDTIFSEIRDTLIQYGFLFRDTTGGDITLFPSPSGDSYQELQAAIDFAIANPGHKIRLLAGDFYISHPLIVAKIMNGDYIMVAIDIEGAANAKNTLQAYTTNIIPTFTDGFALGLQLNKGTQIRNIHFGGKYGFANNLSQMQVDTLPFAAWTDGSCRDTRTSPYAAIVIDPFGSKESFAAQSYASMYPGLESYYLPGMSRSGSTAINIDGCSIYDFVVGILVTGAFQYNGELINVTDCRIDNCKVCYAYSQAQSKANTLFDLMVWGNVHTILDGVNYGFIHTDASCAPFVDVMNVAGNVHQLFNVYATTFPFSAKRVYAEGLYKIGIVYGLAGTHFDDFQIDFGNTNFGFPTPDFYYQGTNTLWTNCMLRLYNGFATRLILDCPNNTFIGGMMIAPPICWNTSNNLATFQNVSMFYAPLQSGALNSNTYDSRSYIDGADTLHLNRADFSGWFTLRNNPGISVGDEIVTNQFYDELPSIQGSNYPVGYVDEVSGNMIHLQNIGMGFRDGDILTMIDTKIKTLP